MAESVSRAELERRLALVARRPPQEGPGDGEREEAPPEGDEAGRAIVAELERLGMLRERRSRWRDLLRHPLVVGAALAVISGIFASLLIPALTRVWQDRPRELALKRELVDRVSTSTTSAITRAYDLVSLRRRALPTTAVPRFRNRWLLDSSVIAAELTTYFGDTPLPEKWRDFAGAVNDFVLLEAMRSGPLDPASGSIFLKSLHNYFRHARFGDPRHEYARQQFVDDPRIRGERRDLLVAGLLLGQIDDVTRLIVKTDATGFSHGFWIFK